MIKGRDYTTLGKLDYPQLVCHPAWEATGEHRNGDEILAALTLDLDGNVPANVGEVWCLSTYTFANGTRAPGCALYRGDNSEGPLIWSAWNGAKFVRILVPPTPPSVLARSGPEFFARNFGLDVPSVFPMMVESDVGFAFPPMRRALQLDDVVGPRKGATAT